MPKTKIIALGAIGVLVIVFIIFAVTCKKENTTAPTDENTGLENQTDDTGLTATSTLGSATTTATSTPATTATTKKTTTVAKANAPVTQSYADALKAYSATGYRMQFVNCRASPGSLIIKKGKTFMLDNRDNKSHKIKVGNVTYNVGAYGYAIATAKTLDVNYVLCDGAGSGKITVEP
jgi:hypothetical protein